MATFVADASVAKAAQLEGVPLLTPQPLA